MGRNKKTTNAVDVLHRRYIGGDAERKASLQAERENTEVARMVYELRQEKGLRVDQLAEKSGINREDIVAMERDVEYRPTLLILHKLSNFYKISQRKLAVLAGVIRDISPDMRTEASRFVGLVLTSATAYL